MDVYCSYPPEKCLKRELGESALKKGISQAALRKKHAMSTSVESLKDVGL
jgi:hypothetical protein